jgi:hypothetical protein
LRRFHRPFAGDLDDDLLLARAVPMHAAGRMQHIGARLHRPRLFEIQFLADAVPPCARDHHRMAILRMEMRVGMVSGREAHAHHIDAGLRRIAEQHRLGGADAERALELNLIGGLVDKTLFRLRADGRGLAENRRRCGAREEKSELGHGLLYGRRRKISQFGRVSPTMSAA